MKKRSEFVFEKDLPQWEILKRVLKLAFPVILSNLLYVAQNAVSLLLVAPLGERAVAEIGFASTLLWVVYALMATVYTGLNVLTAQRTGAGEDTSSLPPVGMVLAALFALPVSLMGEEAVKLFLKLFIHDPTVIGGILEYLRPIFLLLPLAFATNAASAYFNGLGKTTVIFVATLFVTVLNVALAVALIYGKLGLPALGVEGAGWAVAVAESLALFVYLLFLPKLAPPSGEEFLRDAKQILKIGLPSGVERAAMSLSYNVFVGLVAVCGIAVLAAFQIGLRIEAVSFTVGMAFSFAATTLAGQNFGANNPEGVKSAVYTTLKVAAAIMTSLGVAIFLASKWVVGLFSSDPQVVRWATTYLGIIAFSQPLMAVIFVLSGAIRGLGKTKIPLVVNLSNFWLVRIIPAMLLLKVWKSPFVPWGTMIAENISRSSIYLFLFRDISRDLSGKG